MRPLLILCLLCSGFLLTAQAWSYGLSAEVGAARGYNVDQSGINRRADQPEISGGIAAVVGVRLQRQLLPSLTVGLSPSLLFQDYTATFPAIDGRTFRVRERLLPRVALVPVQFEFTFSRQRVRPVLGAGAGAMVRMGQTERRTDLRLERLIPYLEVSVGFSAGYSWGELRPQLIVRHGLASIVTATGSLANNQLSGERWAYLGVGILTTFGHQSPTRE